MHYNELLQLYFERSNAIQSLWTLYVAVIGGVLAFASLRQRPDLLTTGLVTILFAFFAHKNPGGIYDATLQRYAVLDVIKKTPVPDEERVISPTLLPPEYTGVRNFHIVTDGLDDPGALGDGTPPPRPGGRGRTGGRRGRGCKHRCQERVTPRPVCLGQAWSGPVAPPRSNVDG